ncbi:MULTISPECIES: acyl-CoA dehydrogenase family protein [unclassified Acinetobacter]|uniref:acyl-CoA dehydrogenase family protein n=1 Tax=unclassified Acinetobacter TaxID=196816 RepID=UPI0025749EFD|nr:MULTISPECIES: acyl-CoA dehydrogenase family protein [unclassified Acinetobacter]MDM1764687.1 acyl-CoA dehydrogenase family protein [Acinetobacter sp. 226-1]MDM1768683.1 acyl-CoA dehydrogenase family protein [Acinetobacter sp. 226-4]
MNDLSRVFSFDQSTTVDLETLCQEIRERAITGEFDDQAYVSQDMIQKLKQLGVYRALVPKRFGGLEVSPRTFCELIEKLSMADGSVGWVASFGMSPAYLGGLPEETLQLLYKDSPDIVFAGGIFPPQPAEITDEGVVVKGRWKFSSGCMGADIVGVGISPRKDNEAQGLPRMAVLPAHKVKIEMTWDTVGLKGTGSHDLVVEDVLVAKEWTFVRGEPSKLSEPFFKYPSLSLATQVLTVVGIGVAAAALEEFKKLAPGKASITGGSEIANRPVTQYEFAQVEAEFKAARTWFYETMDAVWNEILAGQKPSEQQISDMRLSCTHAARVAARVARKMQMLAGMTAIYTNNVFSRFVNDTNVVTQHAFMGDATLQNAGSVSFGLKPTPGYL